MRPGGPASMLCAGIAVCFALYLYLTWREMQRMDAKVSALATQMAGLHKTTENALAEMRAAVEAPPATHLAHPLQSMQSMHPLQSMQIPFLFEHVAHAAAAPSAHVRVQDDEEDEEDGYDEDEDDRQIKDMLMTQLDGIDEAEEEAEEEAATPASASAPATTTATVAAPPGIDEEGARALKVDELRKALKDRGLDSRGPKDALVARLVAA